MQQERTAPDLSISIVSYNTKDLLRRCLRSVFESTVGISFEVFVVDNGSRDASGEMVSTEFAKVALIANAANLGFAAANNQALARATGRYFLLLNSDTEVLDNSLTKLVHFMDVTPRCGITCPQLYYPDGRPQLSYYRSFMTPRYRASRDVVPRLRKLKSVLEPLVPPALRQRYRRLGRGAGGRASSAVMVDSVPGSPARILRPRGACFMIRKACVDEIGPLDEHFFMYGEDSDWALRAHKAGWGSYLVPDTAVLHVGGASTSPRMPLMKDIQAQSDYHYYFKHFGAKGWLVIRMGKLAGACLALLLAVCACFVDKDKDGEFSPQVHLRESRDLLRRAFLIRRIRPSE